MPLQQRSPDTRSSPPTWPLLQVARPAQLEPGRPGGVPGRWSSGAGPRSGQVARVNGADGMGASEPGTSGPWGSVPNRSTALSGVVRVMGMGFAREPRHARCAGVRRASPPGRARVPGDVRARHEHHVGVAVSYSVLAPGPHSPEGVRPEPAEGGCGRLEAVANRGRLGAPPPAFGGDGAQCPGTPESDDQPGEGGERDRRTTKWRGAPEELATRVRPKGARARAERSLRSAARPAIGARRASP